MPASQIEDSWNLDIDCKWLLVLLLSFVVVVEVVVVVFYRAS